MLLFKMTCVLRGVAYIFEFAPNVQITARDLNYKRLADVDITLGVCFVAPSLVPIRHFSTVSS